MPTRNVPHDPDRGRAAGESPLVAPVRDIDELCPPGSAARRELVACLAQMFREVVGEDSAQTPAEDPVRLAVEAYRRGAISLGKLGELLGLDLAQARELVWGLPDEAGPAGSHLP